MAWVGLLRPVLCHPCRWWCCQRRRARPSARVGCSPAAVPAERPPAVLVQPQPPLGRRAVSSSDRLCCFLSGAASPPSHSVLRNAPRAASLAFTAVWLGLPSPSFPEKASVCRGRCWGRWGREVIWWGAGGRAGSGAWEWLSCPGRNQSPFLPSSCCLSLPWPWD